MAVIGNAPFQGLVSGGNIIDASIEGVDLSTSAIAARLGYTPVDPGAATFTANPTISSGTANGVAYLNGSKVLTTGSALVFDGTNVGIGTSSPQGSLDVTATGATVNQFLTGGAGNNLVTGIFRIGSGLGRGASIQGFRGASSNIHSLDFYTYNAANVFGMRLDSSGNLGIGTSSPSVKLDVTGSGRFNSSGEALTIGASTLAANTAQYFRNTSGYGALALTSAADQYLTGSVAGDLVIGTNAKSLRFGNLGTGVLGATLDSSGNLVVGNSTAWSRLHVTKTVNNTNTAATNITDYQNATFILHNQDDAGTGNKAGMFFAFAGSPGILAGMDGYKVNGTWETGLRWYTNSQTGINTGNIFERMRLDQNGNLGIGNTSPSWKLDVAGAQESLASFRSSITTGAGYARFINGGGTFYIGIESSNGTRISNSGLAYAASMTTEGSTALTFGTNNTNRMTIDTTGRLLIGTTSSSQTSNLFEVNRSQQGQTCAHVVNTSTGSAYAEAVITTSAYNTGLLIGSIGGNVTTYGIANIAGVLPAGLSYIMQFSSYPMVMNHYAAQPIVFGTSNVERMRVGSTGNIGIATTATYNGAKLSVAGSAEIRGDIRGYYASRAGLASGASVTLWSVPNGYWGTEVSMTLYVSQRDDNIGALSNATYNITAFASGGVVITSQGASTYGASKPFTLTASSGSGGMSVSFTNNAGAASTGITMVANVLVGYGAIAWGF